MDMDDLCIVVVYVPSLRVMLGASKFEGLHRGDAMGYGCKES